MPATKILNAAQIRAIDAYTIQHEPIASIDLMERASQAFVDWFTERFWNVPAVKVFCGLGNNGGDGMAIARLLSQLHFSVDVYVVLYADQTSPDCATNLERLNRQLSPRTIRKTEEIPGLQAEDIIIDAIFGSGLSRPVEGLAAAVVEAINASHATVIAVDIPSGLFVDAANTSTAIVRADHTVTFQLPKLAFLLPENEPYTGEWHKVDIGLHPAAIQQSDTPFYYITADLIKSIIRKRGKFSHKGTFGHGLLIAGSYGKMGAAVLCAKACLRSGIGLLTLHIPNCGYQIMQMAVSEAMTVTDTNDAYVTQLPDTEKYITIGLGPGLGTHPETAVVLEEVLTHFTKPIVLDADALNMLSHHKSWLEKLPPNSILTPHPKEFERLTGKASNDYERLALLHQFSSKYKVITLLKGAHTAIALPNGTVYFNSTGNPGMATGGTGDILTGMITSLLAQGYEPYQAAILGVYLHGLAGDLAAQHKGYAGLIASDLIDYIPQALQEFGA
jgi:NAD(P)H-hydrate epimerase